MNTGNDSVERPDGTMLFNKENDIWSTIHVGYDFYISMLKLRAEFRGGYNLTNKQFSDYSVAGVSMEKSVTNNFSAGIYTSVGMRL